MRILLYGRDNGQEYPGLSLHSYYYAPQNRAIPDSSPYLLATNCISPTDSWRRPATDKCM